MPKAKPSPKKKTSARKIVSKPPHKKPGAKKNAVRRPSAIQKKNYSEEYTEYLERYELYGTGRPRLSPAEFDRLDDELLDLLAQEMERGLDDDQVIRVKELEYLLLDSEQ
jgi:hypothetical protein